MGSILALLPIFGTLIDRLFPDPEKAAAAKLAIEQAATDAQAKADEMDTRRVEAGSKVVVAEAQSESYAARNWRPHLMYSIMIMMLYNWMVAGILRSCGLDITIIPIPNDMWTLLSIGVGGYVVGKSGENIMSTYVQAKFNDKKFYDAYKKEMNVTTLDQPTVDKLNKIIEEAKE